MVFFAYKKLAQFAVRCALPPRRSESPVCATDNKPSCVLHLLGWFIGSRGFSSLERRPEFWVLQNQEMGLTPADPDYFFSHSALEPGIHCASYPTEAPHLKKKKKEETRSLKLN